MRIHLTQPTNSEHYGPETTPEQALVVARNCLALAAAYARRCWPDAEIETALVPETTSWGHRSYSTCPDGSGARPVDLGHVPDPVIQEIDEYLSRHWYEEPLWEREFDADGYLEAHRG